VSELMRHCDVLHREKSKLLESSTRRHLSTEERDLYNALDFAFMRLMTGTPAAQDAAQGREVAVDLPWPDDTVPDTTPTTNSGEIGRKSVGGDEVEHMARLLEGMDYEDTRKAAELLRRLSRRED
jgi:hypothetical protein